jgi:hypothetical protein
MSRGYGWGRYKTGVYPIGPGGGGGGVASTVPLSRQRFIDGDTTQAGLTGAAAAPFKTIAQFIASRTAADVADATANYVGWLMPSKAGYAENVTLPPYVSTELRADSFSVTLDAGVSIQGNVLWENTAGGQAASRANVSLHNISVTGIIEYEDDENAPVSSITVSGDESSPDGVTIGGWGSNGNTKLSFAKFLNVTVAGTLTAGFTTDVYLTGCAAQSVTAKSLFAVDTHFTGDIGGNGTVNTDDAHTATFVNCTFAAADYQLVCKGGAFFDGPSWNSYVSGCTGGVDRFQTPVLVTGGFTAASVEGKDLPVGGNVNVSLNGNAPGTTAGYTKSDSGNHYSSSGLTGDRTVTLLTSGGEKDGDTLCITKKDLAAHTLSVLNGGTTPGTIAVIASGKRGNVIARFVKSTGDWVLSECGEVAA